MSGLTLLITALLLIPLMPMQNITNESPFQVTTVFLVRHAERQTTPPHDPPLNANGKTRAKNLARILSKAGIRAIFTSQFVRTKETARPLAEAVGVTPTHVTIESDPADPNKVTVQSIKVFVDGIHQHPGEAVLVIGHTNTVPEIISMLGGDLTPNIPETEFDNLFAVTIYQDDKAKVIQLKY